VSPTQPTAVIPSRARRHAAWSAAALLTLPALLSLLSGCLQADSLGGEPPDTVTIVGAPTWDNGVARLMDLKCAVCHRVPATEVAPSRVPLDLDLRRLGLTGTTRGAQDVQLHLQAGILQGDVAGFLRMPPAFATPLVDSERAALVTWATDTPLPDVGGGTTPADGLVLYAAYCQGCHGVAGQGGKYTNVHGNDPVIIQLVIQQAIAQVPIMVNWPALATLPLVQQQAIATYLAQP
jgi:mono/diheme cytochrome c family protein